MFTLGADEDIPSSDYTRDNVIWLNTKVRALKDKYGLRPDFIGPNNRGVVWTPVQTTTDVLLRYINTSQYWLSRWDIPNNTLQPTLIKTYKDKMAQTGGFTNYEWPPADIAAKGVPGDKVLKAQPSYDFWYYASALAIHFDALSGATPTSFLWFVYEKAKDVVPSLPRVSDFSWIKWVAYATVGVLAIGAMQKRS